MFITFSSDAFENITYFQDIGKRLIALMGHSGTVPGAIKAEDVADALNHLERGLGRVKSSDVAVDDEDSEPEIGLAKRAIPLIHLLQAAVKKNCDVLWDSSKSPG